MGLLSYLKIGSKNHTVLIIGMNINDKNRSKYFVE